MDADIKQLLESLNIEQPSAKGISTQSPSLAAAPAFHHQSFARPKPKRLKRVVFAAISICLMLGGAAALFFTKGKYWDKPAKIFRVYEASVSPYMERSITPVLQRMDVGSTHDLSTHILPSGEASESPAMAAHLDLLKASEGRKKALEEIRQDVDSLMAACIHTPDMAIREAMHRAIARFDAADVNLTHSLTPLILSKRSCFITPQDQQKFNETLAFVGLGNNLEEYSKAVAHVATTKELIERLLIQLRTEKDICSLAETMESASCLFAGLRKDCIIPLFVDLEAKQKEAVEVCRHSVQEMLEQFPSSAYPRRCSSAERNAVAFFQREFPTINPSLFAKIDGFLVLPVGSARVCVFLDNDLGVDWPCSSVTKVFVFPEGPLAEEGLSE